MTISTSPKTNFTFLKYFYEPNQVIMITLYLLRRVSYPVIRTAGIGFYKVALNIRSDYRIPLFQFDMNNMSLSFTIFSIQHTVNSLLRVWDLEFKSDIGIFYTTQFNQIFN